MKRTLYILLAVMLALTASPAYAKKDAEAKKVLDATAKKVSNAGGIKATFEITTYYGQKEQGRESGTMQVSGKKLHITTSNMETWFDGKTQWNYLINSEEVNVFTPTASEMQQLNPYAFLDIYKTGFDYTIKDTKYKGKSVYEVRLLAENKNQELQEILLTVSKDNYTPLCVRLRQGKKNWTRIQVNSFVGGQKFSDSTFKFDKKKYPNAEIVDLR